MRWDRLFEDLAAQWEAELGHGARAEVADRTRRERAAVRLVDRLAAQAEEVELLTVGAGRFAGRIAELGGDFLVLADGPARSLVVASAVVQVSGLGRRVAAPSEVVALRRFGLGYALRGLARDRAAVRVSDVGGRIVTGTIEGVGADHLDLVEHPLDVAPRRDASRPVRTVPFAALVALSSA